jgi:adenylyltransferase/sulfurtransferase
MNTSARTVDKPLDWYNRYARHIALEEVGEAGQLALNAASILVIGAGGLGSPVSFYLTAAGVGTLGLVDFDTVSLNNLQRQILHGTSDEGRPKVQSALETLRETNPEVAFRLYSEKLNTSNIAQIIREYDIVVDASDNFSTRFLINDVCVQLGKPLVFGAVLQFSGQVTVFTQDEDCGCYRCLFPEAPAPELVPTCAEAGIFGVTPGIIGSLQASQVLMLIFHLNGLNVGDVLKNRLLAYDGKQASFRTMNLAKNPACPACGDSEFDFQKVEYVETCSVDNSQNGSPPSFDTATAQLTDIG